MNAFSQARRELPKVDQDNIPELLKSLTSWVVWEARNYKSNGKFDKVPVDPRTGRNCRWSDPANHLHFSDALDAHHSGKADGVGIVLTGDPVAQTADGLPLYLVGIDLDAAFIEDPGCKPELETIRKDLGGYAEVSPSGKGLRVFVLSREKPRSGNAGGGREIYAEGRFLTVTGRSGRGQPKDKTEGVQALVRRWWPEREPGRKAPENVLAFPGVDLTLNKKLGGGNDWTETDENIARVETALGYIPPDADYETWRNVIWAVASLGWDCGQDLVEEWSRGSERHWKDGGSDAQSAIESLLESYDPDRRVTVGTLLHHAYEQGMPRAEIASEDAGGNAVEASVAEMNEQFAWSERQALVYRFGFENFIKPTDLAKQFQNQPLVFFDRDGKRHEACRVKTWMAHPSRRQHRDLVFAPGEGTITAENCINTWTGMAVAPSKGDVEPFKALVRQLFPEKRDRRYVLQWLAHKLQRPDLKVNTALLVWSSRQGVGKNLLFEAVVDVIGRKHATVISQDQLAGAFNPWAANRILVVGDEVLSRDKRAEMDRLKAMITGTELTVNGKFQPQYTISNLASFVFLSNHGDAVHLDASDRRFFVHEVVAEPREPEFYRDFANWRDNGGLAALHHFLVNVVDLKGFNPKAPPPMTPSKRAMIGISRSALEDWAHDVMEDPVAHIRSEVATTHILGLAFQAATGATAMPSPKAIGNAVKKFGAVQRESQIRLGSGKKVRAFCLAHQSQWAERSEAEWAEELARSLRVGV